MRFFIFAILILGLSACGFKPMLAKNNEGYRMLDEVKLVEVNGPDKLKLERIFLEALSGHPHANPLYDLHVTVNYSSSSMAILKDSQTTRYRVKVNLHYRLLDAETQKNIDTGNLYLYSSYDVASSEFMNYIAERYVGDNILKELCEELKSRLNLVITTSGASQGT